MSDNNTRICRWDGLASASSWALGPLMPIGLNLAPSQLGRSERSRDPIQQWRRRQEIRIWCRLKTLCTSDCIHCLLLAYCYKLEEYSGATIQESGTVELGVSTLPGSSLRSNSDSLRTCNKQLQRHQDSGNSKVSVSP
jgi:hypothetical protein